MDFTALNSFFDHIYVITLEREMERQQKIAVALEGLDYTFAYGVDKKDLTIDDLVEEKVYDEQKAIAVHPEDKPMNTGQIGRSWSHRLVYEDMLKNGHKKILILEDHIVPHKEGLALFEEMIRELPADWELLYLDYHKNLRRNFKTWVIQQFYHIKRLFGKVKWSAETINNLYAREFKEHLFIAGYHDFASAYAITDTAAKKLIDLQTPLAFIADNLLSHACSNKSVYGFVSCPKVFLQESQLQDKRTKADYVEE